MTEPPGVSAGLARVLLVDDNPASRLALQTVLQAGGYCVDAAASAAEAVSKLDECDYELVLTDLRMESPEAGYRVLSHARIMEYKPATALLTTYQDSKAVARPAGVDESMLIASEDLPELLSNVANLIAHRATRLVARSLRHPG